MVGCFPPLFLPVNQSYSEPTLSHSWLLRYATWLAYDLLYHLICLWWKETDIIVTCFIFKQQRVFKHAFNIICYRRERFPEVCSVRLRIFPLTFFCCSVVIINSKAFWFFPPPTPLQYCFQILNVKRSNLSKVLILLEETIFWTAIFY